MIVSGHNDVIQLAGALHKNQWLTIKAAAKLLLQQHAEGILIDCSELTEVSEEGTKTFLDAMRDIQNEGARIMVVNLPEKVYQVVRSVPGVRSQLPIASSLEEARASLQMARSRPASGDRSGGTNSVLVPLIQGFDVEYAVVVAARASRDLKQPVTLAGLIEVPRSQPLQSPMPESEGEATALLARAEAAAKKLNMTYALHVERVRDIEEGVLQLIKSRAASHVIIGAYADHIRDEGFLQLVDLLLHRAPCHVIIARQAPDRDHPLE